MAIIGEKPSDRFLPPGKVWVRNHIPLRLSGKTVDLYQRGIVFERRPNLVGKWHHTTTAFVRNVSPQGQRAAERIVVDLGHLLSFATMSQVRPFAFSYGPHSRRWNGEGSVSQWRPPIELDGEAVAEFVRITWRAYRRLKRSRKLPELIHYLTLTDTADQPVEVRMLLAFVALENLKGTWAKVKGIPYRRGQFLKTVYKKGKPKQVPWTFEELLQMMFADLRMRPPLRRLVRIRNQIIHFGLTSRSFRSNIDYYQRAKSLEHEYLLRLLDYRGQYLDYKTMAWRTL